MGLFILLLLALCTSGPAPEADTSKEALAFIHVNVISMTQEGVTTDQTVIVEGDKITQTGPSTAVRIPPDTQEIDGRGKYLMPGLVDFHVHLRDQSELLSYLAHGVTSVVHMSGPMGNVPDVLDLRQRIASRDVLGPNIFATGRILDGNPAIYPGVSTVVATPAGATPIVAEQQRAGVDFIKVYNNLTSDVLRAIVAAAHQRGLAVIGHVPRRDGRTLALQTAIASGQDMIAHGEEFFFTYFYGDTESRLARNLPPEPDRTKIPLVVRLLRESGTAVTPTLSFVTMTRRQLDNLDAVLGDPEAGYLHPEVTLMWKDQNPTRRSDLAHFSLRERAKQDFLKDLIPALQAGGVILLLGTDSSAPGMFPGKSAHLELRELVAAGLTPYQALATGTRNAGQFVRKHVRGAEAFGTVSPGQRADLLLLHANPLSRIDDISQIAGVVVGGRWLSKEQLERMRSHGVNSFNR